MPTISPNSRVFGQRSSFMQPLTSFAPTTRIRPEFERFQRQQRELQLETQRQTLADQRQRANLLNSLFGRITGGGDGLGQPGFPDAGGGGGAFGGFQGLLDTVLGDLSQVGEAQRAGINEGFDEALNNQLALFADRGLASSNLAGNAFTGVERGRQSALTELESTLAQRRAGATTQIGLAGLGQQQDLLTQLLSMLGG